MASALEVRIESKPTALRVRLTGDEMLFDQSPGGSAAHEANQITGGSIQEGQSAPRAFTLIQSAARFRHARRALLVTKAGLEEWSLGYDDHIVENITASQHLVSEASETCKVDIRECWTCTDASLLSPRHGPGQSGDARLAKNSNGLKVLAN